jgi:hypothetical protein
MPSTSDNAEHQRPGRGDRLVALRRRTRHTAFRALLGINAVSKPVTYKMLIAPQRRA